MDTWRIWKDRKENLKCYGTKSSNSGDFDKSGHSNQILKSSVQNTSAWWVINLSNTLLSDTQETLLAHGPNFVVTLKTPYKEYITAIEVTCQRLPPTNADEWRADISRILKQSKLPKPNLTREELKALKQLKSDQDHINLIADKGVALVVIKKMKELLEDTTTYRPLNLDPTKTEK